MSEMQQTESLPRNSSPALDQPAKDGSEDFESMEREREGGWKEALKRPATIAALVLTLGVIGLVAYLERGSFQIDLQPPEVSYELLPNEGLTEGVPIAIKLNEAAVFKISDPMEQGAANRAKELVAVLESSVERLIEEPGRIVTIDLEGELPRIIEKDTDGSNEREIIQITADDVKIAGHDDPKWLARTWAERLTDTFKLFVFGEAPQFTAGTDFGEAITTLYIRAKQERGAVSKGSLEDAYESLTDAQRSALVSFPPPEEAEEGTPGVDDAE